MRDRLLDALVESKNEAADEVLLEALRLGNAIERPSILAALIKRGTTRGLCGVIGLYRELDETARPLILEKIRQFHPALRACGLGADLSSRLIAMELIAQGRQGRMAYVLAENLNHSDPSLSTPAITALAELAQWVAGKTQQLRSIEPEKREELWRQLMEQRPEIEQTVARAMDVHPRGRGRHGADLLRAALLLCDHPASKTLAILKTGRHGGQSAMVRRLQQPPEADWVAAFLLAASHGGLRTHFGLALGHVEEAPVLDALLNYTHWLKDHQLGLCMHQVTRGAWWTENELRQDLERRTPADVGRIAPWIVASGLGDMIQDQRLGLLTRFAREDTGARLQILRLAMSRPMGSSVELIRLFLEDADERLSRLAARELIRRKPPEYENILLQLMTAAPESVRRVIARSLGRAGFEHFWRRFDRLDPNTRQAAGRAMMKLLPDAPQRLQRKLTASALDERIKAMQIVQELSLTSAMRPILMDMCHDDSPRIRSKAISALGELEDPPAKLLIGRVLKDPDARVRANAVEALGTRDDPALVPLLAQRARSANNRERANAIKALHHMKMGAFSRQLSAMLNDPRPEHRISALWVLKQVGWWQLLADVGQMARADASLRVRRYALNILRELATNVKDLQQKAAG